MHDLAALCALAGCAALTAAASPAQGFDNRWLAFEPDPARLVAPAELGAADVEERDYATGDFDRDGWTDLAIVRKKPHDTSGRRRNLLLMNREGTLVERTKAFASASDIPGDQGFLSQTNDRDVVAVDVDGDGWLDLVTATTLSAQLPKHLSHPRVYRNLGADAGGRWLGLRHEDLRFPQLLLADGQASWPRFTSVAAGDVTGDGLPDLYFGDNDKFVNQAGGDMGDRLLLNDGFGFFTDETAARLRPADLDSFYTTSARIADMNGDGIQDIVRNRGYFLGVSIAYNAPPMEGSFPIASDVAVETPYYTSVGDLNRDGLPDLVVSSNDLDVAIYNTGTGATGLADWSQPQPFAFLSGADDGADDGFASDSYITDLDGDGWNDVVICDFDIELDGCNRRLHIYHNRGAQAGGFPVLLEEAEAPSSGWRGAAGLAPSDLNGTHDAAIFDLDGDGDLDMVLGRCSSTEVWLNQSIP